MVDVALRERLVEGVQARRKALAERVAADCAPYVPCKTGELAGSVRVEEGAVEWTAPHARRVYYGEGLRFETGVNRLATARWFEMAKAVHGEEWVRYAQSKC